MDTQYTLERLDGRTEGWINRYIGREVDTLSDC